MKDDYGIASALELTLRDGLNFWDACLLVGIKESDYNHFLDKIRSDFNYLPFDDFMHLAQQIACEKINCEKLNREKSHKAIKPWEDYYRVYGRGFNRANVKFSFWAKLYRAAAWRTVNGMIEECIGYGPSAAIALKRIMTSHLAQWHWPNGIKILDELNRHANKYGGRAK